MLCTKWCVLTCLVVISIFSPGGEGALDDQENAGKLATQRSESKQFADKCTTIQCQNGGKCVIEKEQAVCNCTNGYTGKNCELETCEEDSECHNGGKCQDNGSEKTCSCLPGTEGPFCETVTDCKYKSCGTDANCSYVVESKAASCVCYDKKLTFDVDKKCKAACKEDSECHNGGYCWGYGSVKTCSCKRGTDGPYCETVTECEYKSCGTDAKCSYVVKQQVASCVCNNETLIFDDNDKKCKDLDSACYSKFPNCQITEGWCSINQYNELECKCPRNTELTSGIGCKVLDRYCDAKFPKCRESQGYCVLKDEEIICECPSNAKFFGTVCYVDSDTCGWSISNCVETGGSCILDNDKEIQCICTGGQVFQAHIGCQVEDSKCDLMAPICRETNGTCDSTAEGYIVCNCPGKTTYMRGRGCYDLCMGNPCLNDGICSVHKGTVRCYCQDSFTGEKCEIAKTKDSKNVNVIIWMLGSILVLLIINIGFSIVRMCRSRNESNGS